MELGLDGEFTLPFYPSLSTRLALAAIASGVALGIAGRLTMRAVALASGIPGGFSLGGSLEVVAFGVGLGAPLAFGFLLLRRRVVLRIPWLGPAYGLAIFGAAALLPPASARSAMASIPDTHAVTALAFGLLLAAWGLGLEYLSRRLDPGHSAP